MCWILIELWMLHYVHLSAMGVCTAVVCVIVWLRRHIVVCFVLFFVCLSLFLLSQFLTFEKPKCFHASDLRLSGASTKLSRPAFAQFWQRPTRLLGDCAREAKWEKSENLETPQNSLEAKSSSQTKWATCTWWHISSYILYWTPDQTLVWGKISSNCNQYIYVIKEMFTFLLSVGEATRLPLHYIYFCIYSCNMAVLWNEETPHTKRLWPLIDQNSPFSGWLNIYRLSERGRVSVSHQ